MRSFTFSFAPFGVLLQLILFMPLSKTSTLAHAFPHCYSFKVFRRIVAEPILLRSLRSSLTHRWGVVQLVGHLTVNEDGEGSNPSAPAKFPLLEMMVLVGSAVFKPIALLFRLSQFRCFP
jgi:hypothetical protein